MRKTTAKTPAAKTAKSDKKPRAARKPAAKAAKAGGRQEQVLTLLRRKEGATLADICDATKWQRHTARAFLSAIIDRKLGHTIATAKDAERGLIYRIG